MDIHVKYLERNKGEGQVKIGQLNKKNEWILNSIHSLKKDFL